jgi:hypothetical protein
VTRPSLRPTPPSRIVVASTAPPPRSPASCSPGSSTGSPNTPLAPVKLRPQRTRPQHAEQRGEGTRRSPTPGALAKMHEPATRPLTEQPGPGRHGHARRTTAPNGCMRDHLRKTPRPDIHPTRHRPHNQPPQEARGEGSLNALHSSGPWEQRGSGPRVDARRPVSIQEEPLMS